LIAKIDGEILWTRIGQFATKAVGTSKSRNFEGDQCTPVRNSPGDPVVLGRPGNNRLATSRDWHFHKEVESSLTHTCCKLFRSIQSGNSPLSLLLCKNLEVKSMRALHPIKVFAHINTSFCFVMNSGRVPLSWLVCRYLSTATLVTQSQTKLMK
jgi:hypothetical protein